MKQIHISDEEIRALINIGSKDRVLRICLGHKEPIFEADAQIFVASNRQAAERYDGDSILIPDDIFKYSDYDGGVLSEYHQLFILLPFLEEAREIYDHILVTQYRKFISITPGLESAPNMPHLYWCDSTAANSKAIDIKEDFIRQWPSGNNVLCSHFVDLTTSYVENYRKLHIIDDYLRFALCIPMSLNKDKMFYRLFTESKVLIPTPSLGLSTFQFFLRVVRDLEAVWKTYLELDMLVERYGYQRRVGGFLLERLHSALLLSEARSGLLRLYPGFQYVVSDEPVSAKPSGL